MIAITVLLFGLAPVWMCRTVRHFERAESSRSAPARRLDVALGLVLSIMLWWVYIRVTDRSVRTPADLWRTYSIYAGGATVPFTAYAASLLLVISVAVLFVFAGHFICRRTGFLGIAAPAAIDLGVYYFVGMAAFLSLLVALATITGDVRDSAVVIGLAFAGIAARTLASRDIWTRARSRKIPSVATVALLLPLIVCALSLLQHVVPHRSGPDYELFAEYIAQANQLPLINRHFGQSLLASLGLMIPGTGSGVSSFALLFVNDWLYVSQIGLLFVLFRFLRELSMTATRAAVGVAILMLGGSALSFLPHIMYDHDYPLILNIYADSVFGIAGFLIIVIYLLRLQDAKRSAARTPSMPTALIVPAIIMTAFNYTAELNAVIAFLVLGAFALANRSARLIPWPRLTLIAVVCAAATLAGALGGGVFSTRFASDAAKRNSPFFERASASAQLSVTKASWWYLPYLVVGFDFGFGNLPVPSLLVARADGLDPAAAAVTAYSESSNEKLIARFRRDRADWSSYSNLLYLVESRVLQMIQALWYPLVGVVGLGLYLRTSSHFTALGPQSDVDRLRLFWIITTTAFGSAVAIVFFTNAVDGNGVYWKWALTRFLEPGLCLASVALVALLDRATRDWHNPIRRRGIWIATALLMSFGTLYRIFCFDL